MGKVYFGVPPELSLKLRDKFGIKDFIETGTYRGGTAVWAGAHFEKVTTIEGFEDYYKRTSQAQADKKNITFLFGDSRDKLPGVLKKQKKQPALLWLDAHWMGNTMLSAGTKGECALMDELEIIGKNGVRHFILIDDLHCFQGELNKGADPAMWPRLEVIEAKVKQYFPDYFFTTFEDVIIAVPSEAAKVVQDYMTYPGLRVVVPTSNKYVGIIPGFSHFLNKFWGAQIPVTVMRYDVRPPKTSQNFNNVAVGPQANYTWCSGLATYLAHPQAPRVFVMMLEDYYLTDDVDTAALQKLWQYICEHDEVVKIDLSGDRMKFPHQPYSDRGLEGLKVIRSDDSANFRGSIQAAIWKTSYLLKHLNADWDPWQFEKHGCRDGAVILGTEEPILKYVNAVGGAGNKPGEYDRKKIPEWMWQEMQELRIV